MKGWPFWFCSHADRVDNRSTTVSNTAIDFLSILLTGITSFAVVQLDDTLIVDVPIGINPSLEYWCFAYFQYNIQEQFCQFIPITPKCFQGKMLLWQILGRCGKLSPKATDKAV